jgi:hypothetical protein
MKPKSLSSIAAFPDNAGWNYSVFLKLYPVHHAAEVTTAQVVPLALGGDIKIANLRAVSVSEVLSEIELSLSYPGDSGAGLEPTALASPEFQALLSDVLEEMKVLARIADRIEQFHIEDGHPAYPVFWDFAYVFFGPLQSFVLVGSSSD